HVLATFIADSTFKIAMLFVDPFRPVIKAHVFILPFRKQIEHTTVTPKNTEKIAVTAKMRSDGKHMLDLFNRVQDVIDRNHCGDFAGFLVACLIWLALKTAERGDHGDFLELVAELAFAA